MAGAFRARGFEPRNWKAARKAEEAVDSAVLDLRKCCDHFMLTDHWRSRGRAELQLSGGGILTIGEQRLRLADGLQTKLQVMLLSKK